MAKKVMSVKTMLAQAQAHKWLGLVRGAPVHKLSLKKVADRAYGLGKTQTFVLPMRGLSSSETQLSRRNDPAFTEDDLRATEAWKMFVNHYSDLCGVRTTVSYRLPDDTSDGKEMWHFTFTPEAVRAE